MNIAVLGTGMVGRAHAEKLVSLGHEVTMGTGNVEKTLKENKPDATGQNPFGDWYTKHGNVKLKTFSDAVSSGEIILNALNGAISVRVMESVAAELASKILIDISNPLDFSEGFPPSLSVSNTDSLGEQIQRALPDVKVVKTLNTINAYVQTDPASLADADHHVFVSGNDSGAKAAVEALLKSYGWKHIIDLGDISTARGTEMLLPLWLRLMSALKQPNFNFKVVTGPMPNLI